MFIHCPREAKPVKYAVWLHTMTGRKLGKTSAAGGL
jgi:hypothetical protein